MGDLQKMVALLIVDAIICNNLRAFYVPGIVLGTRNTGTKSCSPVTYALIREDSKKYYSESQKEKGSKKCLCEILPSYIGWSGK